MEEASFQRIKHKLITSTIFSKSVQLCVNNLFKIRSPDSEAIWNDLSLGEGGSAALPFSVIVSDVAHVSLCELSTNLNNPYSLMWWKPLNLLNSSVWTVFVRRFLSQRTNCTDIKREKTVFSLKSVASNNVKLSTPWHCSCLWPWVKNRRA